MVPDRMLDLVGRPGGPLADASLWHLEVIEAGPLSPNIHRLVLTADGLGQFRFSAGQDLMLRFSLPDDRIVNRRYTIRKFDPSVPSVTFDVSLHASGPGTDWIRAAQTGSRIDAIGPRGKVALSEAASEHVFICDETGIPGALAMIESMPDDRRAVALFEIGSPADEQAPSGDFGARLEVHWLCRDGRARPGDTETMLDALAAMDLPLDNGHVYVAAEARVTRDIHQALCARGLADDQISAKAYWRRGLPNAEHGEPTRED
jgi:NADPH-dependent ferric siderophore reductase